MWFNMKQHHGKSSLLFDERLYNRCKAELSEKNIKEIISKYKRLPKIKKRHISTFLSLYYSPLLTLLKQLLGDLKKKRILEIGYGIPMFLEYLQKQESIVYGIDINPAVTDKNLLKMSVETFSPKFLKENKNKFHAIIERITLSRLYDEEYFLISGRPRFKKKKKILSNLYSLLKPKGILVLQDDRGTIFTETQFMKAGFKKILKEMPVIFNKNGKKIGWNTLVVYQTQ